MQCCYCGESFGRGKSPKTKHGDKYYHEECLMQYHAVRAYFARGLEQPQLPSEFTAKMRNRSRTRQTHAERMRQLRLREKVEQRYREKVVDYNRV